MTPRFVWAFATVFLCLLLPARAGIAIVLGNGAAGAAMTAALFVLPLWYTVPRGRALWERHTWWLLAAQAVLTYLPFLVFGQKWAVGLSGLLGGLLLLTISGRLSWLLLAAVVAVEAVLRLGVLGVYPDGGAHYVSWAFVVPVDMALPLFALVRLSALVAELRAARTELVGLAVTRPACRAGRRRPRQPGPGCSSFQTRPGGVRLPVSPARGQCAFCTAARVQNAPRRSGAARPPGRTHLRGGPAGGDRRPRAQATRRPGMRRPSLTVPARPGVRHDRRPCVPWAVDINEPGQVVRSSYALACGPRITGNRPGK